MFSDVLTMKVLYESFRAFACVPRALAGSSESVLSLKVPPERIIPLLVPRISITPGSYASMMLAMTASTDLTFLQ